MESGGHAEDGVGENVEGGREEGEGEWEVDGCWVEGVAGGLLVDNASSWEAEGGEKSPV